jgi:protein TonB
MSEKKDKHFIKKTSYPGGQEAFKKFVSDELKYPEEALKNKIEGTVVLKYAIDYKGKVSDVKVIKSLGYGCDEEAKRVIGKLEFEVPKEHRKLRVMFHKEIKIFFKLPTTPKSSKPAASSVKYSYKSKEKSAETTEEDNTSKSYIYTIRF